MKLWQKLVLFLVLPVLILGVGILIIQHQRNTPVVEKAQPQERPLTSDEIVQPRKLYIDDLKSAKDLIGKTIWVQAGYELDYFPYAAHRVDFAHKTGVLPAAEPLAVQEIVTEKAPAKMPTRVPLGDKQVFAVFKLPNDAKTYAVAIGYIQGSDSKYYCDDIFYYDDPHVMYKHWPADVWQAVDQHQVKPGMNELQTAMSLGVMQQSDSSDLGNRTVTYDAGGKKWSVTFLQDKATDIKQQ
jgi:hypothetical protein